MPKCSVLVIEDEKKIQSFMGKILKRQEYRIFYADTGTQGLELIRLSVLTLFFSIWVFLIWTVMISSAKSAAGRASR